MKISRISRYSTQLRYAGGTFQRGIHAVIGNARVSVMVTESDSILIGRVKLADDALTYRVVPQCRLLPILNKSWALNSTINV